ncbi:MAG: hypothetical protein GX758_02800 [Tenericutes bacterium]|nr:hypothetical protein [Mycoplasmatota bacterium]
MEKKLYFASVKGILYPAGNIYNPYYGVCTEDLGVFLVTPIYTRINKKLKGYKEVVTNKPVIKYMRVRCGDLSSKVVLKDISSGEKDYEGDLYWSVQTKYSAEKIVKPEEVSAYLSTSKEEMEKRLSFLKSAAAEALYEYLDKTGKLELTLN